MRYTTKTVCKENKDKRWQARVLQKENNRSKESNITQQKMKDLRPPKRHLRPLKLNSSKSQSSCVTFINLFIFSVKVALVLVSVVKSLKQFLEFILMKFLQIFAIYIINV